MENGSDVDGRKRHAKKCLVPNRAQPPSGNGHFTSVNSTPCWWEVPDDDLREQLEAQMDENLCDACDEKDINLEKDLDKWLDQVKTLDDRR
jgi:hypothetical protein